MAKLQLYICGGVGVRVTFLDGIEYSRSDASNRVEIEKTADLGSTAICCMVLLPGITSIRIQSFQSWIVVKHEHSV